MSVLATTITYNYYYYYYYYCCYCYCYYYYHYYSSKSQLALNFVFASIMDQLTSALTSGDGLQDHSLHHTCNDVAFVAPQSSMLHHKHRKLLPECPTSPQWLLL